MNPMLQEALGSILRWALTLAAGYLVSHGIWSADNAEKYVAAAVTALLALGWALWSSYIKRRKLVTAMATPSVVSEKAVEQMVQTGQAPPVSVPKERAPHLEGTPNPMLYKDGI